MSEEKNLTPRDEMKIYEAEESECLTRRTTETNMQDVPCAATIVSARRHFTHQSLPKSAESPSVPLLCAQSHSANDICRGFTLTVLCTNILNGPFFRNRTLSSPFIIFLYFSMIGNH